MCSSTSLTAAREEHVATRSDTAAVGGSVPCTTPPPLVVVPVVVPSLALNCLDHHFASGVETLRATYTTQHLAADNVTVRITGTNYGGDVVYEADHQPSGDGGHALGWNGTINRGALNGGFVTPLHSPYTLTVTAATSGLTQSVTFRVLYRSIAVALGTYNETGTAPVQATDPERWVQYRLNELGYIGGPVNGTIAADTTIQRAMMRYAHEHPALDWFAARSNPVTFSTSGPFLTALATNAHQRTLLEHNALPAAGAEHKVYIDHNYFYNTGVEFSTNDGHSTLDEQMLDRFELPVEATITLMSQNDADGTAPGVASPQAVGPAKVRWSVVHVAEDCTTVHAASTAARPSRTRDYLTAAFAATRDPRGHANCPATLGGSRLTTGARNPNYFHIGTQLPPYTSTASGELVFSTAYVGPTAGKRGKAGILFRGSWIAGDRFQLKAAVTFDGLPGEAALFNAHTDVFGMFADNPLEISTGTLVVWRRHRVAAVLEWPAPAPARAVTWADVVAEFRPAFCELDTSNITAMDGATFVSAHLATSPWRHGLSNFADYTFGSPVTFGGTSIFPHTPPVQGKTETAREYRLRLASLLDTKVEAVSQELASAVAGTLFAQRTPGAVIIHGKWVEPITVKHKAMGGLWQFGSEEVWNPSIFCIGLSCGVAVIDNTMYPDFHDRFVIAHEMSHSRFLRHHEAGHPSGTTISDVPIDHDLSDNNCTMSYPWKIPSRQPLAWGPNDASRPGFCGKCILKLRGWKITTGALPANS